MKHIIYKVNEDKTIGQKLSSYEGPKDESSTHRSYLLCPPHAVHLELLSGMDEDCVSVVFFPEVSPEEAHPEMWTNGEISVFNANDIPVLLNENNEPYLDPSFEYVEAKETKKAHYKFVENPRLVLIKKQKKAEEVLEIIRQLREPLLKDADVAIFKLEDDGKDSSKMREYRKELRSCTDSLKEEDGKAKLSCMNIVVSEFEFPKKP